MELNAILTSLKYVSENMKSFNKRISYFNNLFPTIGSGSGRIVYDLGKYVLKLAKNAKGIAQNEVEVNVSSYDENKDILANTLYSDDDYTWLISEKANKISKPRFKELVCYSINDIYCALYNALVKEIYHIDDENIYENEFYMELHDFAANYSMSVGDLGRISSYGEAIRYGKPAVVITDYGLDFRTNQLYNKSKRIYEYYNNSDGNDDFLSDIGGDNDIRNGYAGNTPLPDVVDERELKYMDNSSNVEVKDSCKLGGGKICNQGDINNFNISKLKEDIEPKEANNIESTINTIINNKRDVGFAPHLSVMQIKYLNNNGIGLIPIKNKYGIAYILYKNKEKALKLRDYANSKNGFLNDKTPEEARYVGKLLSYSDKSIDEYIKRKYKNLYLDTRTPDDFNDLDENLENEGVGDKYAEKRFGIDQEFSNFDKQYGAYKNNAQEEVVYRDSRVTLIKNPKSLNHIGSNVRGVIDTQGNLYIEENVNAIHEQIVRILSKLGLIKYDGDWGRDIPKYFITVQRYYDTNLFYLGESNEVLVPDYDRYDVSDMPSADEALPVFRQFLNSARSKNPDIKFFDQMLNQYEEIRENNMINESNIMSLQDLPFKDEIKRIGGEIYSVGGAVRDEFLGKESKDLDILITGIPMNELEGILSKYGKVDAVGKSFGILKFKPKGSTEDIDVAIPRTERPTGEGGHKGFQVTSDHNLSIEDDLFRRDLTINAIAKSIDGKIIDPYHGVDDLKNKIIRIVNPQAFSDDPLRMLRAIQFSTRFGFEIEPNTMEMIKKNANRIKEIPSERILGEFDKIVHKGNPLKGAELLIETNIYEYVFDANPNSGILNRPFNSVKTMGEFLFLLTYNVLQNPSEFYKSNLSGDINTYKEIKSYEIGYSTTDAAINLLRSVAHNMYITSNYSISSNIIIGNLKNACNDLLSGKYPKTFNELAVNGNDLMSLGLKGKEIGDAQRNVLFNIYSDKLLNKKDDIIAFLSPNNKLNEDKKKLTEYGCLMLFLDVPVWSKLTSIVNKKDLHEKGIENEPHVTILYGFHDEVTSEQVFSLYKENYSLKPLKIAISGISYFETPEFDVVKFDVVSDELHEMNELMKTLPNTQTFPDYHPHITIAYLKKGCGEKYTKKFKNNRILFGNELVYTWKGHKGKEGGDVLMLDEKTLNESAESSYEKVKKSLMRSRTIGKEMKEKISKYLTSGSSYHEGGRVHGLSKPNEFREKTPKSDGVSLGADKKGFYCYTHRAASKRYESPEKIPVSAIEFIESTG